MSKLAFMIGAVSLVVARQSISIRPFFHARQSLDGRSMALSKWLSTLRPSVARKTTADALDDTAGAFYIGTGDQFDDDRRRIHIVR